MPYEIYVHNGKYCVRKKATGEIKKCYTSKAPAKAYNSVLNMRHAGIPPKKGKSKK